MNKTAIKNFAIWARLNLIESTKQRAYEYEITKDGQNNPSAEIINGRPLSKAEQNQRKQLIEQIKIKGFDQVMEEAAYTWFNRFIALRYMEVNGYLPTRIRVFTNEEGDFKPEILKEAMTVELDGLDHEKVLELLDKQDNETLYKMLLIAQCNALSTGLPYMFEKISNWTELLFPANLLKSDSVIGQMISSIPEGDWTDAVQIIGWLYQYYNSELKDETFALLKKNVKITKERIPAATQLFTPDWIVRYMVENSLGRIYIQRKLVNSGDWLVADEAAKVAMEKQEAEAMGWKYYLPEAEQEPDVRKQLIVIANSYTGMKVEDIKVIDPCCGSGHILVYAFDVLMQIYTASGWSERDAAKSILENNLFGLDIDDRAGQMAYFAVMMKARKYNRRILNVEIRPNVMSIQDSSFITEDLINYVAAGNQSIRVALEEIKKTFTDAKEYGSILNVKPVNFSAIYQRIEEIEASTPENLFAMQNRETAIGVLLQLIKQDEIMAQKYAVVVTNPPYMGASGMEEKLNDYVRENFPKTKGDLFTVFIEKNANNLLANGILAMITQHTWMFTSSYEDMRKLLLSKIHIGSLLHLGPHAFEEINGEVVQTVTFTMINGNNTAHKGVYYRLVEYGNQQAKENAYLSKNAIDRFETSEENYEFISGTSIAYWVSNQVCSIYKYAKRISQFGTPKQGLATGANDLFLRAWFEVLWDKVCFDATSNEDALKKGKKWFPYNKGGENKRWYGNNFYVVNWENDGFEIKHFTDSKGKLRSRPQNLQYFFKTCCTWSLTSSGEFGARFKEPGFIFDINGMSLFVDEEMQLYALGYLCSKVCSNFMRISNPSLASQSGDIAKLPFIFEKDRNAEISSIVSELVSLTKEDFDESETSWNFKKNPLV